MSLDIVKDSTDVIMYVVIRDSVTGALETGFDVTTLDFQYTRTKAAPSAKQDVTALSLTTSDHADNKAIEIDATNSPGLCRVDFPDAAFATGVDSVRLNVTGAGFDISPKEVPLVVAPATAAAQTTAQTDLDTLTDATALPGQEAPTETPTMKEAIMFWYKQFIHKETQTATEYALYAANGTTKDQKATLSDDGTTFTKGSMGAGA